MVPAHKTGSWGMMAMRLRRSRREMVDMSMPSIMIVPARASRKRNSANVRGFLGTSASNDPNPIVWFATEADAAQHGWQF